MDEDLVDPVPDATVAVVEDPHQRYHDLLNEHVKIVSEGQKAILERLDRIEAATHPATSVVTGPVEDVVEIVPDATADVEPQTVPEKARKRGRWR